MSKVAARPRRAKSARRGAEIVRVPFHGEELEAVRQDERVLVPIHNISDRIELNPRAQLARLRRVPWACVSMVVMQVPGDAQRRTVACIDLETLPMWLATIDVGRVRPELREKLILYQREAAAVLRDHFFGRAPAPAPLPARPRLALPPAAESAALRRLETAERVLDQIEHDLAVLTSLGPEARSSKLHTVLTEGLLWAQHAIRGASYALGDPDVRERSAAAMAHVLRLNHGLHGPHAAPLPRREG